MKRLLLVSIFALSACATAQTPTATAPSTSTATATTSSLASINANIDNAMSIAVAGNDKSGQACLSAAKTWINSLPIPVDAPALPASTGTLGDIATARIKVDAAKAKVTALKLVLAAGVPQAVSDACAPVVVDSEMIANKILAAFGLLIK